MALLVATPVAAVLSNAGVVNTSAPFTAPAGSRLVVLVACNAESAVDAATVSVTNTGTVLSWTRRAVKSLAHGSGQAGTSAEVWEAWNAAAQTVTVRVTSSGARYGDEVLAQVCVCTGDEGASYTGATATGSSPSGLPSASVTAAAGSILLGVVADWATMGASTPGVNTTEVLDVTDAQFSTHFLRSTVPTAAGAAALSVTAPAGENFNLALVEVKTAGGGPAGLVAGFGGAGVLTAAATPNVPVTVAFAAGGVLTAAAGPPGTTPLAAAFGAAGVLSAGLGQAVPLTVAFGAAGALSGSLRTALAPPVPELPPTLTSAAFLAALRTAHTLTTTATFRNPFTGAVTGLPVKAGSTVTVDVTAACRRVLNLVTPPLQSVFDMLSVPGGEITVTQRMRFVDGTSETVALGVFCVDQEAMGYAPDGQLQVTAPDRWLRIQRNRFGLSRSSVPGNAAWAEIKRLVEGAWPNAAYPFPGWASLNTSAVGKVGSLVWDDGNRETAINGIAAANSLDLYFDRTGLAVLKPLPVLTASSPPVWLVDASASGVMIGGDRKLDLSVARNAVVVSSSATDVVLTPVLVENTHRPSDDPLSRLGPLGFVPVYYASPLLRTTAQMTAAGKTVLQKQLSKATQVTLTAVSNPGLDGWDVVDVMYPPGDFGTVRPVERQMLESTVIPLTPDGVQTITLRGTRVSADDTTG